MVDEGPLVYGKYQLIELLARGGMAEVYKAKSHGVEGFEKILVIKRILRELSCNPAFVSMFIREAKISVTLSHANIVQVFDLGRADDSYFIAMEYVAGGDFSKVLRRSRRCARPLPIELAVFIGAEVAKGLDYAHRRRDAQHRPLHIVHRDVSPHNILISYEGEVKLADFGIAKARTTVEPKTDAGVLKGKYAYMSPEQARGEPVHSQTDLFALGTVLYEAIAGKNPFQSESTYETLKRVRAGRVRPLAEVVRGVPEDLSEVVAKAMAPRPEDRYPNAGQLYQDLIQVLYAGGHLVGAAELAAHMDKLREASEFGKLPAEAWLRSFFERRESERPRTAVDKPDQRSERRTTSTSHLGRAVIEPSLDASSGVARPQAERRDVTLLLVESDASGLVDSRLRAQAERFGGRLLEPRPIESGRGLFTGALFGVEEPDGHDAEAAARCAHALRAATRLDAPIAIHSGRVLVTLEGEILIDRRHEKLIDEALRAIHGTGPDETVVTRSAAGALRRTFETAPLAYRADVLVLGPAKSHEQAFGGFIGRREELRRVGTILADANAGTRRVVSIVGDPGFGKTRFLLEILKRLRLDDHDVGIHVARIEPHDREVPLSGCQAMLRAVLGIDELDAEAEVREKTYRLRELGLRGADLEAVEMVLGLPARGEPPPSGERSLRAGLARIANKLAEDRLTVFALDGAENIDDASMTLFRRLFRDAGSARITVVLTYRPGNLRVLRELPGHEEVVLGPFGDPEVARLTAALIGVDEVPKELLRELTQKSGGNPLFVSEYVRALLGAGAVRVVGHGKVVYDPGAISEEVPKTLRGLVAARLGRLGPKERHILQIASILDSAFPAELVAHVAGEELVDVEVSLSVLEGRGIVRRIEGEYQIVHELVGEVLRSGLTDEARRELHGAVAVAVEQIWPDHLADLADRLAYHCRQAGAPERSAEHLERAASRLESELALAGAVDHLLVCIELFASVADHGRILGLYERVGQLALRGRVLRKGAEQMDRAIELAETAGRNDYLARFCMLRGELLSRQGSFAESRALLDRARRIARTLDDEDLLRDVTVATADANVRNGDFAHAIGLLREALGLARRAEGVHAQLRCLFPLALAQASAGERNASLSTLDEARALALRCADRFVACELHRTELLVHYYLDQPSEAIEAGLVALEIAKEHNLFDEVATASRYLGESYLRLGELRQAFAHLRYGYDLALEHKLGRIQFSCLCVIGFLDALKFSSEEGRRRMLEACSYARQHHHFGDLVQSKFLLAYIDHAEGRVADATAGFREVLRLAVEYGHRSYERAAREALHAIDTSRPLPLKLKGL